ncbi:nucleotide pyrophosphohydrolase [Candidatus Peregrinibacteria bacterium]|jgi:tetrapyrrole methylase family protein / MazG family protein|nr:nucleotide pyrophosphohydrolase [Candidatus Peregrinibacteria bacterium]
MTTFDKLVELSKRLRAPDGCPWDRKQTIKSLAKCIEEESGEVLEAIEKEDHENLKEELGDLFFSMIMMMNVAEDEGHFTATDVFKAIGEKIVSRHTWVFGDDKVETAEEALELWKKNKKKNKKKKS